MSNQITREQIAAKAVIHDQARAPTVVDRSFELPAPLYAATVACYLGFIGIMALGFGAPALAIPLAIFAISIVAGFAIPLIWVRMNPENHSRSLDWGRFSARGIQTFTGRVTAGQAAAQVLVLPVLILLWGLVAISMAAAAGS
ncbi:MAG: hypothetical protein WCY92_11120 [Novosphingobium sp.]|uniref:hypothetical protein n=1 Tax=Tsuneonella sp. CC-YZS046 TaxID=3042152 RepID=UPI002D76986C|nr:hypothetical protein [Tsuneonella sp. CC-YZS046]WRO67358.1 hypothetical protein U8326_04095 [Tsuneonella sp. CC-YZS046]